MTMKKNTFITTLSTGLLIGTMAWKHAYAAGPAAQSKSVEVTSSIEAAKPIETSRDTAPENKAGGTISMLKGVTSEVEGNHTFVNVKLSIVPDWKAQPIEDHGTFIQIPLPNTQVTNSGEFFDGTGPYLRKIAVFQVNENDGAIRLFLNQDAKKAKLASQAEIIGDRVIVSIDHQQLEQLTLRGGDAQKNSIQEAGPNSATTQSKPNSTNTNAPLTASPNSQSVEGTPGTLNSMKDKLSIVASFCAVMILLLVGLTVAKKKQIQRAKDRATSERVEPVSMRILNHISLSPRQRLTLVQVGSKQVLLGVSQDRISFLTEVSNAKQPQSSFQAQLMSADGHSEVKLKETHGDSRPLVKSKNILTTQGIKDSAISKKINIAVGDDAETLNRNASRVDRADVDKPFEDITKMIRERLKNAPPNNRERS
jgi:flagellar biogenesis protein FliO